MIETVYKAIIIDDEPKVRESLMMILEKFCPEVRVVAGSSNFSEGYSMIQDMSPDIVFLDIQINSMEGTGLDLASLTRSNFKGAFIFISGYREYAADAFRLSATDYLLKPLNIQQVIEAVKKASSQITATPKTTNGLAPFHLPTVYGFILVNQEEIIRFQAEGPYTHLSINNPPTKKTCSINLGEIEKRLHPDHFFRVHKSHIVQRRFINEYQRGDGGTALMSDGTEVPISRSAKEPFLKWLG